MSDIGEYRFIPSGKRLSIEQDDVRELKHDAIIEVVNEPPQTGTVVDTGPEVTGFKTGDRVIFSRLDAQPFRVGKTRYILILEESQVFGTLELMEVSDNG